MAAHLKNFFYSLSHRIVKAKKRETGAKVCIFLTSFGKLAMSMADSPDSAEPHFNLFF
jgi:hypothetical protein